MKNNENAQRMSRMSRPVTEDVTPEEIIAERLIEAYQILARMHVKGLRPSTGGGSWPEYIHTREDILGWAEDYRTHTFEGWARIKTAPLSNEVSRMEEAFEWTRAYLEGMPQSRKALLHWAMAKAYGLPMDRVRKPIGMSKKTFYEGRQRALKQITRALATPPTYPRTP